MGKLYIRTKEGILKVDAYDNSGTCVVKTNTYPKTYYKEDYIKMADTIEELCDCFEVYNVGIFGDNIWKISSYEKLKDFLKNTPGYYDYYFGFIYVNKKKVLVGKSKGGKLELCTGQTLLQ